jgi:prolyl-tRNA synthetase
VFGLKYQDTDGQMKNIVMGCYGIGVSRLMWLIAEKFADDKGLVWPVEVSPATHIIIVIGDHLEEAKWIASALESTGATVLIDDRNTGFGQKAGDADLFGIPNRIIISDKTIEKWGYELKKRTESEGVIISK